MELKSLVVRAQNGDADAYALLVGQFQDRAVAYAYSVLGDFGRAEDAAQEAFIEAFACLPKLQEPLAFAAWLRRIVFKQCDRILRKKQISTVSFDSAIDEASHDFTPHEIIEAREKAAQVRQIIATLPPHERRVILLFYMGQNSQNQIAEFLDVPITTVKKRLYSARRKLEERMIEMMQEDFETQRPSRNNNFAERVTQFTQGFSQQIDEGQSLVRSLVALAKQEENAELRQAISQIQREITGDGRNGATLSQAISKYPQMFGETYVAAIRRGETDGNLAEVLRQLGRREIPSATI